MKNRCCAENCAETVLDGWQVLVLSVLFSLFVLCFPMLASMGIKMQGMVPGAGWYFSVLTVFYAFVGLLCIVVNCMLVHSSVWECCINAAGLPSVFVAFTNFAPANPKAAWLLWSTLHAAA